MRHLISGQKFPAAKKKKRVKVSNKREKKEERGKGPEHCGDRKNHPEENTGPHREKQMVK